MYVLIVNRLIFCTIKKKKSKKECFQKETEFKFKSKIPKILLSADIP